MALNKIFSLFFASDPTRVGTRLLANRDITSSNQTALILENSGVKVTGKRKRYFSLGDAGEFRIPNWLFGIGNIRSRVQAGLVRRLDELGRPVTVEQVGTCQVDHDNLVHHDILQIDPVQAPVNRKGFQFPIGSFLEPNKDFCNFRETRKLLDVQRFFDDTSFSVPHPEDETLPFTVVGVDVGYYENGLYISKSSLKAEDRIKNAINGIRYLRHYKIQGPFVDNWTFNNSDGTYETIDTTIFLPRDVVEQKFKLWSANKHQGNSGNTRRAA